MGIQFVESSSWSGGLSAKMTTTDKDVLSLPLHPSVAQVMGIRFLSQAPLCPSVAKLMGNQRGTTATKGASSTTKSTLSCEL
jgi:hypothetical protein